MKNIFSIILVFITTIVSAQEITQTIRGVTLDKQTQSPLPGCIVQVLGVDNKNAVSDENGKFRIEGVPIGRRQVKISLLSYKEKIQTVIVTSGKEIVLNVELEESVVQGEEVVVRAEADKTKTNNKNTTVSSRSFSIEETSRYAGSRNDPARMAANFAGVSGANDSRNDIIIRGNSPLGVLWRLNGMDIPNPNHFGSLGSTGGPVSILNNNTLDNSDFLSSAFPADYGNALAGVFDLKMRTGNNEKHEFLGQVGFNGFEFAAEGPFSKKKNASFLVDYRYSTLGVFKALNIDFGTGAAVPQYQDLTFNVNIPTAKAGKFNIYGLGGLSYVGLKNSDRSSKQDLYGYKGLDTYFRSNVGMGGVGHTLILNSSSYLKTNIGVSGQYNSIVVDYVLFDSLQNPIGTKPDYRNVSYTVKYSANSTYNKKFNAKNFITAGIYFDDYETLMADSIDLNNGRGFHVVRNFKGNAVLMQAFVNWQHKFTDKLVLNLGARYLHFLFNNTSNPEPRAGLKWSFRENQSFSIGTGLHSQIQPLYVYFSSAYDTATKQSRQTNLNLGLTKSAHGVIAYDVNLGKNTRIKAEAYYQYLFNVPVKNSQPYFSVLNLGANFESP
ncbi:MAG: TonB-dependent receptor, partial [Bacteroidia bacterium]